APHRKRSLVSRPPPRQTRTHHPSSGAIRPASSPSTWPRNKKKRNRKVMDNRTELPIELVEYAVAVARAIESDEVRSTGNATFYVSRVDFSIEGQEFRGLQLGLSEFTSELT